MARGSYTRWTGAGRGESFNSVGGNPAVLLLAFTPVVIDCCSDFRKTCIVCFELIHSENVQQEANIYHPRIRFAYLMEHFEALNIDVQWKSIITNNVRVIYPMFDSKKKSLKIQSIKSFRKLLVVRFYIFFSFMWKTFKFYIFILVDSFDRLKGTFTPQNFHRFMFKSFAFYINRTIQL